VDTSLPGFPSQIVIARFPRHHVMRQADADRYLEKAHAAERKSPGWMFGKKGRYSLLTHMGLGLGK